MDAAPAPTKKTTHVATAAEANCLRSNNDVCTLATAKNEIVEVGGPPITTPKLALEAHEMVVAHAWDSEGRLAVASRRRVLYHNQTYKPVGEVKDLALDARDRLRLGTFAGVENVEDEAIGWPGRCCVCVATIGEDVFAAATDHQRLRSQGGERTDEIGDVGAHGGDDGWIVQVERTGRGHHANGEIVVEGVD